VKAGVALSQHKEMDKYRQAFQDEAREILVDLESTLLELNDQHGNSELVGKAFRSLHTIKGSGSMFGFDRIASFTHNVESAFDEVRQGRMRVTSTLIDLTLAAMDQIKAMLDEASDGIPAENAVAEQILVQLKQLTGGMDRGININVSAATVSQGAKAEATDRSSAAPREWRIYFAPGPSLLRNGSDPLLLLEELKHLGECRISANIGAIPTLGALDPERCYMSWDIVLSTAASVEAIRDVFIFVEDCCELIVEPVTGPMPTAAAIVQPTVDEGRSDPGRRKDDRNDSIRVPTAKLDHLVNLVGELVTVQARLNEVAARYDDSDIVAVSEEVERLTAALRENSMSIRMLPIGATFERFRRLIHDLARDLHKDVELTVEGADTELDKTVVDQLNDPLMHLVRNSMDHGIETPELRVARGKHRTATLHLSARHSGANVLIVVADDGGGIDAAAVRERAIEKGLVGADCQLTEAQTFALILEPGFSTAQQITDVSGRGVGMDVVRQRVEALRGTIDIASKAGVGTTVTLRLPLTMAIIDGLLVRVGEAYFVLPLANTLECIELNAQDVEKSNGKNLAHVRGEIVPYIRLREHFNIATKAPELEQIMIADTEHGRFGFVVDQVLGDHQTVIKNLGRMYRQVQIVSGATILGNGSIALILDPHRLVEDALRCNAGDGRKLARTAAVAERSNDRPQGNST
jgi:two-component system chemotaxis sensor kinase CheA